MTIDRELGYVRPVATPGHEAALGIVLTGEMLSKEADRTLRPLGLTRAQFNVLMLLGHQATDGSLTQTQLGRMLLVHRSNVTGLVDRMEESGWIRRTGSAGDRRVNEIRLTAAGRRLLEKTEAAYNTRVDAVIGAIPDDDRARLVRTLQSVRQALASPARESAKPAPRAARSRGG